MMTTQTIKGAIFYDTDNVSELCYGTRYRFFPGSMAPFATYIPVIDYELTFDLPADFDPRPVEIKALREKRNEIMAEAQAKATEIDRRIAKLEAITYEPEAA